MELYELLIIITMAGFLSIIAQYLNLLTFDGVIASLTIGMTIGIFASTQWLFVLITFTALGFVATLMGIAKKKAKGLQEGEHGERMLKNVVAVGITPCLLAIILPLTGDGNYMAMSIAYISSIAVAAADTVASEIGVKDSRVRLITNFKKVPPGTDGGVSITGTLVAAGASLVTAAIGWVLIFGLTFNVLLFIPAIAGIAGCFMDSLLGATVETKGYISKYTNNAVTAMFGSVLSVYLYIYIF